jgi:hypothetical protein
MQLVAKGSNSIGDSVTFSSPNAPVLNVGDPFSIAITAPSAVNAPNGLTGVGYMVPITPEWPTYFGNIAPGQTVEIWGVVSVAGNLNNGIGISVGVLPPGGPFPVEQMGYHFTEFVPAVAPLPDPLPSPTNLATKVLASYTGGVSVPNAWDPTQQQLVQYVQTVQGWVGTVTVWGPECLGLVQTQQIADLIGGVVVQVVPPPPFSVNALGAQPIVNGVKLVQNGVPAITAIAGEIAQQFALFNPGSTVSQIETGILSCFSV